MQRIMFLIFILFIFTLSFQSFFFLLHVNESKKIAAVTVAFRQKNEQALIKILFVGDSTGVGIGADTPERSLAGRLGADVPQASISNLSIAGARIENVYNTLFGVREKQFDFVILQVGANDALRYISLDRLSADVDILLGRAKEVGQEVIWLSSGNIGLAPIFPWPFDFFISLRAKTARDLFIEKADRFGVVYIDLYKKRRNDPLLKDVDRFYASDLFHPSGDGYGIWYASFKADVTESDILFR